MERPILFNTEMVKSIFESRKTSTRRILKHDLYRPKWMGNFIDGEKVGRKKETIWTGFYKESDTFYIDDKKHIDGVYTKQPYQVGDILWVRETWQESECFDYSIKNKYCYKANKIDEEIATEYKIKWRPSIHMPRIAARMFLKVTDVRVERLQDMSIEDMLCEGIKATPGTIQPYPSERFKPLWDVIYTKQGYGWNENPYVWVIEFQKV